MAAARRARGAAPHPGIELGAFTATIDAGCGFDGPLIAACFDCQGQVVDAIEA